MNTQIVAIIIQEGGKFVSELIKNRTPKRATVAAVVEEHPAPITKISQEEPDKASSIQAGCVPCSLGHVSVCTGVINEAMRFARSDGINSNEVIDRISHCLQELNALEREDLTPEMIVNLPPWEKELAVEALETSRATRHLLEGITTIDELEKAAANTQAAYTQISRTWFKKRLNNMPKAKKEEFTRKAINKLQEEE